MVDESVLSRMITTIDDANNGFRTDIIQMALSCRAESSMSLFQAILAVSAIHLGRTKEALAHKMSAIQSLAASMKPDATFKPAQLATCMMLCVYTVSHKNIIVETSYSCIFRYLIQLMSHGLFIFEVLEQSAKR
jgi:hypothetical protein